MPDHFSRVTLDNPPLGRASAAGRSAVRVALRNFVHRVLTHPLTMAAKAPVKDTLWTMRGRKLENPQIGLPVRSVLFVCHGNICRSPFAAARAAQLLERAGYGHIRCASAGIAANQSNQCPLDACAAAKAFGVSLDEHAPALLTASVMAEYDVVVVMEAGQLRALREQFPHAVSRVVLLPLLDRAEERGYARYNIADPFGQPRPAFDDCYRRIDRTLHSLIQLSIGSGRSHRPTAVAPRGDAHDHNHGIA